MPELNVSSLLLFAAFVVPGAVSLQVYRLKVSVKDQTLKENIIESMVFSIANFAILYWLLAFALDQETLTDSPTVSYVIIVFSFFAAPTIWPIMLVELLRLLEELRLIKPQANTGWDHYFGNLVVAHS